MTLIVDDIIALAADIQSFIELLLEVIFLGGWYPIQVIFYWFAVTFEVILNACFYFISCFYTSFDITFKFFSEDVLSLFPPMFRYILLTGLTIAFLLRIYFFVKGISILGFRI